jgi:hypothetical protein
VLPRLGAPLYAHEWISRKSNVPVYWKTGYEEPEFLEEFRGAASDKAIFDLRIFLVVGASVS